MRRQISAPPALEVTWPDRALCPAGPRPRPGQLVSLAADALPLSPQPLTFPLLSVTLLASFGSSMLYGYNLAVVNSPAVVSTGAWGDALSVLGGDLHPWGVPGCVVAAGNAATSGGAGAGATQGAGDDPESRSRREGN